MNGEDVSSLLTRYGTRAYSGEGGRGLGLLDLVC